MGKTVVLIDGPNMHVQARNLGFDIDWAKFKSHVSDNMGLDVLRCYYFAAVDEDLEVDPLRPLLDFLDYNGFTVQTKPAKVFIDPATNHRKMKANIVPELIVDMFRLIDSGKVDHIILCSGDGDYYEAVAYAKQRGCRVTVISTLGPGQKVPMIADDLRRQADEFIDILTMKSQIARDYTLKPKREREFVPEKA